MSSPSALRIKCRKVVLAGLGQGAFDKKIIQRFLGFHKDQTRVIDNVGNQIIEYEYASDIGKCLFFKGAFEQEEIDFFARLIAREAAPVVLDIGANIGLHSLAWAKANRNSTIYAFEPSQSTRKFLKRNVERNSLQEKVVIVPLAASSANGHAQFFECEDNAYSSLKDTRRKKVLNVFDVSVTTIDDFVAKHRIRKLSLIKIDVEGLEMEVVSGALNTLRLLKPDLFVEIYGGSDSNPDPEATIDYLCALGYKPFVLANGRALPYQTHLDSLYNYYFTTTELR